MTPVDDRGRLFGRWNVVDALIAVVLLGAIPLLYAGYVLFRPQPASMVAVEPAKIPEGRSTEVTISGNNLRPYMRVSFDTVQGQTFLFADSTKAIVRVNDIPPGVYDVILYDNAQERARLPKAFEVVAAPRVQAEVDLIGAFTAIAETAAAQITPQLKINGLGEVTRVGKPTRSETAAAVGPREVLAVTSPTAVNLPVVIRATCTLVQRGGAVTCNALDNALMRDIVLPVPVPSGQALFRIDQVRAAGAESVIEVRARFTGERAVLERIRSGDQDLDRENEFASGATITSISAVSRVAASVVIATQPQSVATPIVTAGDLATVEVGLRMPARQMSDGWSYRGQVLKPGRTMVFQSVAYEVSGTVLSVAGK